MVEASVQRSKANWTQQMLRVCVQQVIPEKAYRCHGLGVWFGLVFCPRNLCSSFHEWNSRILFQCHFIRLGGIYVFSYIFGTKMEPILKSLKFLFFLTKVEENDPLPISIYGPTKTLSDEFMVSHWFYFWMNTAGFSLCADHTQFKVLQRHLPSTKYIEYKVREIIIWCLAETVSLLTYNKINSLSFLW